jgi:long-chain acyl-CoA synthetase
LILSGRTKDRIVLPNGFKVYPEDLENALRVAGLRDTVVVETAPGRIEAVVLRSAADAELADAGRTGRPDDAAERTAVEAAVRTANAALGPQQRIVGWRFWPDDDFPRTHTLKIRRDPIRAWASGEQGAAATSNGVARTPVSSGR